MRGGIRGARSSRITHRRSAVRSRGPAPTGPSCRAADDSQVPLDCSSRLGPATPGFRSLHPTPRGPPTTPGKYGRFSPHFSRAEDGKHEPTNRAAPRTLCTQWRFEEGTSVHQSELSRCGVQCPKRGSFRLVIRSLYSPIKWLRGPLSPGSAPLPGKLWPLWETVQ